MKRNLTIMFFILTFNFQIGLEVHGTENVTLLNPKEVEIKLDDPSWIKRFEVIRKLNKYPEQLPEGIKIMLINLLEKENTFRNNYESKLRDAGMSSSQIAQKFANEFIKKGYNNYYSYLSSFVADFENPMAIPDLLLAIRYCGGAVVPEFIIKMGNPAIDPLIDCMKNGSEIQRDMAGLVLNVWLNKPGLKGKEREKVKRGFIDILKDKNSLIRARGISGLGKIAKGEKGKERERLKRLLISSLDDKDYYVRWKVVKYLGHLGDEDIIPILEKVAENDPYRSKRGEYRVREEAEKVLKQLEAKKKEK